MKKELYLNLCRSAFQIGLMSYELDNKKKILIPNFICTEIISALNELSISYEFYCLKDNLQPDWEKLNSLDVTFFSSILMVHYFGFPQEIDKFIKYSEQKNLFLIEDNAHGYGGKYRSKKLGTFGSFGISSPRKILNMRYGGILHLNTLPTKKIELKYSKVEKIFASAHYFGEQLKPIKTLIKKNFKKRPLYENPFGFIESKKNIYSLDNFSLLKLKQANLENIIKIRREIFNCWRVYSISKKLVPVFNSIDQDIVPWCFPVYTSSKKERLDLIRWGWENNFNIFTWPSLPKEVIDEEGDAYERWERLICFSTDLSNFHVKNYI